MEPSEPRQLAASAPVPPTGDADSVDVPNPLSLLDGLREDHTETLTESGELFGTPDWDQWLLDRFVHEHESEEQMCEPSDAESASGALSTGLGAGEIPLDAQDALRQGASESRSAAETEVLAGEPYDRAGFERLLQSSFQSLDFEKPKFFWQEGFWAEVFDPHASLVPAPAYPRLDPPAGAGMTSEPPPGPSESKRARRLAPCIFERVVVNLREISWRDQRESDLLRALSKWTVVFESWDASRTNIAAQLLKCDATEACHELLSDYLARKAPSTCLKRANSMLRLNRYAAQEGFQMPVSEPDLYSMLRRGKTGGASLSELRGIMEALTFVRFVFDVECLQSCARSKRCWGLSTAKKAAYVSRADPMRVEDVLVLHRVLQDEEGSLWDRLMAGVALYCIYARCRWSDAQHIDTLILEKGEEQFSEYGSAVIDIHKTMHFASGAPRTMELVAVGRGLDGSDWLATFIAVRTLIGCSYEDGFPTMPAPNKQGLPTVRALSSSEAGAWLRELLPSREGLRTTSHSLKSSLLSFAAKRGISHLDRLALGGHSHSARMSDVYARDALARPLRLLAGMISEIRSGSFVPDAGRAARFPGRTNEADLNAEVPEAVRVLNHVYTPTCKAASARLVSGASLSPLSDERCEPEDASNTDEESMALPPSPLCAERIESLYSPGEPATPVKSEGVGFPFEDSSPISVQSSAARSCGSVGDGLPSYGNIDEVDPDDGTSAAGDTSSGESSDESSDDSGSSERPAPRLMHPPVPPAGTYFVQHSKLKTLHLLLDGHRSFTLCGRSLQQAQNPFGVPGPLRYDTPVCKQCRRATANLLG